MTSRRWRCMIPRNTAGSARCISRRMFARARSSFKAQVDGVLSLVVKKAVADHMGIKV